jgi:hypothetical protein
LLHWVDTSGSHPWNIGSAEVFFDQPRPTGTLPVAVRCRFGSQPEELAMLDTGARWTLIGPDLIELLGDELGEGLEAVTMSTRLGRFQGTLHRLPIRLLADEGTDITVDATCLALKMWPGPNILGFTGFLERLRFALDPAGMHTAARLHFGPG